MRWVQEGNILKFEPWGCFFIMPMDWKLEETSPDLLKLAEIVLLTPWDRKIGEDYTPTRKQGKEIALSFSGGVDSAAAMLLLPEETKLVYNERTNMGHSMLNQSNQLAMIDEMDREVFKMKSNHEKVRTYFGKMPGFSTDYACGIGIILLADYYDIGYLATGTILGSTYLMKGNIYRDFTESGHWKKWPPIFKRFGIDLIMPVACCSEVITNELVQKSQYKDLVHSCIRGSDGKDCNACYKCFRKNLLNNVVGQKSGEVMKYITKRPLHQGDAMVYGINKYGLKVPELKEYEGIDLNYLERYYPPGLDTVSEEVREHVVDKLEQYDIGRMTDEEVMKIKAFKL